MTSTNETMGRLERVDLNEVWETEDGDFTPWLAEEENIELLGEAIGIDLEVEAQEKQVGPFRADILCLDTATTDKHWVLIENQLYRTNHTHLGQLMTYAAGLDAVTIVWIARQFTDEHRAALDWLNEITDEEIRFFGIEVELWRIGDSPPAPKFNIVSKPNDWTKASRWTRHQSTSPSNDTGKLRFEYWEALIKLMQEREGRNVQLTTPHHRLWMNFSFGISEISRKEFVLSANFRVQENRVRAGLLIDGDNAEAHFYLLRDQQRELAQEFDEKLEWDLRPDARYCRVDVSRTVSDLRDQSIWPDLLEWHYTKLEDIHRVFAPRIKTLDASEYIPGETDLDDTEDELV